MFWKLDQTIAKNFFVPLIIRTCQMLNINQYEFAGIMMMVSALTYIPVLVLIEMWWIIKGILFIFNLGIMVIVGRTGEWKKNSTIEFRGFGWVMLIINGVLIPGDPIYKFLFAGWLSALFAAYANMIDRIPPKENKIFVKAPA